MLVGRAVIDSSFEVRLCVRMFPKRQATLLVTIIVLIALAVSVAWRVGYAVSDPTTEDFRVYAVFMSRLSRDHGWGTRDVVLARTTSKLSTPRTDSTIPAALRPAPPSKHIPPAEFVHFCGQFCGRDFMRNNLAEWKLKPSAGNQFEFALIDGPESPRTAASKRVVTVTRVGFDVWHRRAVLMYSVDCSDPSGKVPIMCVELGHAFLQKTNGTWQVNQLIGFDF